jgi:uroporphyrin-III C-methyltransferase
VLRIQNELLCGLPASTPVALIERASLADQRHTVTTLGQLHATVVQGGIQSPAVMVVGNVVHGVAVAAQNISYFKIK